MKREAPTEREIADLIAPVFDRVAEPDPQRLAAIERQLLEQPRLRGRSKLAWWWLVGALLAGAASAWWWAVDYDSGKEQEAPAPSVTSPSVAPSTANETARPRPAEDAGPATDREPAQKQGRVIYQRERSP
ncbi:MAG: hypothetical protein HY083_03990 [Gammaproteobacteria bacterium]|nr:hypothetical protein [Gammaproteobacteria bacterium]